jgi:hypothetical protein
MKDNVLKELRQQYEIVAVNDYEKIPGHVYISKTTNEVNELTEVIGIDLNKPAVWPPQKIDSYLKFLSPLRMILPEKDDIEYMWRKIAQLPEIQFEELLRITQGLPEIHDESYLKYYDLENYIFNTVREKFQKEGSISAEDFFCIVIWKANRAKSNIARLLLKRFSSLEIAVRTITGFLRNENMNDYDRFKYLLDKGFSLPMLSAILTVLYPERFTIYDYRVCSHPEFKEFEKLAYKMVDTEKYWELYQNYKKAVIRNTPFWMNLRQKDQYLWGKSFGLQLKEDIQNQFKRTE